MAFKLVIATIIGIIGFTYLVICFKVIIITNCIDFVAIIMVIVILMVINVVHFIVVPNTMVFEIKLFTG